MGDYLEQYMSRVQGLSQDTRDRPNSFMGGPLEYTPWGEAKGFGGYLGSNAGVFGAGANLLSDLVGAYVGLQSLSLAKDSFKQQKKAFNINLTNQTQAYNTQVQDRLTGRHYATEADRQAAMRQAQLKDRSTYASGG